MPGPEFFDRLVLQQLYGHFVQLNQPCRPRLLIVTDGALDYSAGGFGLSRFVQAVAQMTPQPQITLAHRVLPSANVTIGSQTYAMLGQFKFTMTNPDVIVQNYDQIWMFGFNEEAGGMGNDLPLTTAEIKRIAEFMNVGGGVFSTGDHATLGQAMGGKLPRVRHMRDWASVPMGGEGSLVARNRIDTVVDPGANQLYEFSDQGDAIPQRIYPNYDVVYDNFGAWSATLHPLLRMPSSAAVRTDASGFTNDMDMMPDHPHESVCFAVSSSTPVPYGATYNLAGLNFQEFPNAAVGSGRIGSMIVAYAVSGGRSVWNNVWKPPVNPRMFGIISAFDGHSAAPYPPSAASSFASVRPGRIVCDSTWHHFVNVNLNGFGSAVLTKIFQYYRNMVDWLQPLNRRICPIWIWVSGLRFHPELIEELTQAAKFRDPREFVGLELEAMRLIDQAAGPGTAADAICAVLRLNEATAMLADAPEGQSPAAGDGGEEFVAYILGRLVTEAAKLLPLNKPEETARALSEKGHEQAERLIAETIWRAAEESLAVQAERAKSRLDRFDALRQRKAVKAGR